MKIIYMGVFLSSLLFSAIGQGKMPDDLYQQAVIPWEQGQSNSWELMLKAADAGSTQAMCLIAKSTVKSIWVWSDITYKYFKMASDKGAFCGMLAMSTKSEGGLGIMIEGEHGIIEDNTDKDALRAALLKKTKALADQNNIEAIKLYGFLDSLKDRSDDGFCKWMEKAAKLGDADAMKQLSAAIHDGCGWYLMPGSREKAIRYWTEQAASHGNPRAMEQMMTLAEKEQNIDMAINWLNKAMATGNINSVMLFGEYMTAGELVTQQLPPEKRDRVKGYGAFYAITKQLPPNNDNFYYSGSLKRLAKLNKKLSPSEIIEAKKWAEEWMKTHQVRTYGLVFN
ncbi:tetratricopeptide repeat protein [Aeromonas cavernicola]|uniref:Sel1 repeat family protein n=1 Tax=Aeromonas cavernicola TaxID=1006623 RepID=A0A2H9U194_9GAMM|nr:sel1 repeat family protein [Aeromonas cavernicola]PJG57791.1 hypothetical protein CUC53_16105 [Aeromonas cavernicola]